VFRYSADASGAFELPISPASRKRQPVSHDREIAHPGYDSVEFEDGTKTELTVRERAGRVRFYFPPGANRALIFKAGGSATADAKNREDDTSTVAICGDDTLGAPRRSS